MNTTESQKKEHILPKWVSPKKAILKGEVEIPRTAPFVLNDITLRSIEEEKEAFAVSPTVESAGYLLNASLLKDDLSLAADMLSFLKERKGTNSIILDAAERIVNKASVDIWDVETSTDIARLRTWLRQFPQSTYAWIELGRLYTAQGQIEKAKKTVITAMSLAQRDRYIIRCGVRFFLHILDFDSAWQYIKKANQLTIDPWLKAVELNVAILAKKETPSFASLLPKDLSRGNLFHFSELLESYGNLEYRNGKVQKAKKHFRAAWATPSEAVVTHAEWLTRNRLRGLRTEGLMEYNKSLEAFTWMQYCNLDLPNALKSVRQWQREESYSRSPFAVGSCIACNAGKPEEGVEMVRNGLKANPGDKALVNNLCYSLLMAGNIYEAEKAFHLYDSVVEGGDDIFYLATKGLLEFKKGNYDEGRKFYSQSMEISRKNNAMDLMVRASLNLALAEVEANSANWKEVAQSAVVFSRGYSDPDIIIKAQRLEKALQAGGPLPMIKLK